MKKLVPLLVVAAALVGSTAATAPAQPRQSRDVVQTAVAAGQFKTLARLLTRAGLVGALEKPGPYTVFAPTDAAFVSPNSRPPQIHATRSNFATPIRPQFRPPTSTSVAARRSSLLTCTPPV